VIYRAILLASVASIACAPAYDPWHDSFGGIPSRSESDAGVPNFDEWADVSASPIDNRAGALSDREAQILLACGKGEAGLSLVARRIVDRKIHDLPNLELDGLSFAQRVAGEPHVWPRTWIVSGHALDLEKAIAKLTEWRKSFRDIGERRCGVATGTLPNGDDVIAVIALDALADLAPLPTQSHTGAWLTIDATLHVPTTGARVVVLGPSGPPRNVPTQIEAGHVHARVSLDRPGAFTIQVVAEVATGPRPVLEAQVFADVTPPTSMPDEKAPGEDAADANVDPDRALAQMIQSLRADQSLPTMTRDPSLDAIALSHARHMMETRTVGHDVGDGDPASRLQNAGINAHEAGENVAHAQSIKLAHRALYRSPSHRANLLRAEFTTFGVAAIVDHDGSYWVAEIFTTPLR
jgi:uncharacterized protein YkwD